jgi:hypothetical protein
MPSLLGKKPMSLLSEQIIFFENMSMGRGSNPKKNGFLDWIWMGNPKSKKNPKNPKISKKSKPNKNSISHFFWNFKFKIQLNFFF